MEIYDGTVREGMRMEGNGQQTVKEDLQEERKNVATLLEVCALICTGIANVVRFSPYIRTNALLSVPTRRMHILTKKLKMGTIRFPTTHSPDTFTCLRHPTDVQLPVFRRALFLTSTIILSFFSAPHSP